MTALPVRQLHLFFVHLVVRVAVLTQRWLLRKMAHVYRVGAHRHLALDLLHHLDLRQLDLLLDECVGLIVHFRPDLFTDLFALLHFQDLIFVLTVEHLQRLLQPLAIAQLLGDPGLRHLQLLLNFLRLCERGQLQSPGLTFGQQVRRDIGENGLRHLLFNSFRKTL